MVLSNTLWVTLSFFHFDYRTELALCEWLFTFSFWLRYWASTLWVALPFLISIYGTELALCEWLFPFWFRFTVLSLHSMSDSSVVIDFLPCFWTFIQIRALPFFWGSVCFVALSMVVYFALLVVLTSILSSISVKGFQYIFGKSVSSLAVVWFSSLFPDIPSELECP